MTYLLDTVTLSDSFQPRPNAGLEDWLQVQPAAALHTSVICLGEMWRGLDKLGAGAKRTRLEGWLIEVTSGLLELQVLPVTPSVGARWGQLVASLERIGQRPSFSDSLIAATALVHNLTVVTRNTRDFERCGIPVLDPWTN